MGKTKEELNQTHRNGEKLGASNSHRNRQRFNAIAGGRSGGPEEVAINRWFKKKVSVKVTKGKGSGAS